jgi:hypothetical protein
MAKVEAAWEFIGQVGMSYMFAWTVPGKAQFTVCFDRSINRAYTSTVRLLRYEKQVMPFSRHRSPIFWLSASGRWVRRKLKELRGEAGRAFLREEFAGLETG